MLTQDNWQSNMFSSQQLNSFISVLASPGEGNNEVNIEYAVTLSNKDFQELDQTCFSELDQALEDINERYGSWDISTRRQNNAGKCDSCES